MVDRMKITAIILQIFTAVETIDQPKRIYDQIFAGYNPNIRPVKTASDTTVVVIDPIITSLIDVNEPRESIVIAYWMHTKWNDQYLSWDPSVFEGVDQIAVPSKVLWLPDVTLSTVTSLTEVPKSKNVYCHIKSTGQVSCQFNQVLHSNCPMNVQAFPFDRQNCTLLFYSWSYGANEVRLNTASSQGNMKYLGTNTEWEFINYTNEVILREYTNSQFSEVRYYLTFKRKPEYYLYTLVIPSFLITNLALIGLFSPFNAAGDRQEKVTMGLTTLLTMAVLLVVVSEQMPRTASLPMIGSYILLEIVIASLATVCTVALMYVHKRVVVGTPVPKWLLTITCLRRRDRDQTSNHHSPSPSIARTASSKEPFLLNKVLSERESKAESDRVSPLGSKVPFLMEECLRNLIFLKNFAEERQRQGDFESQWTRVCNRLDLALLILFAVSNLLFTFVWLIVGLAQ